MATSVPGSESPVQEPLIFPEDWDDPFAQWTGDEFPNLFGDLPEGTDLNVGDAPSKKFDDFPIGPDLDVGVGPSNLFDDYINGADVTLGVRPSTLLDEFPIGVDVNVHGEPSNLINGFPIGIDLNVHDCSEISANYQEPLTYDIGTLSLPTATDLDLLPCMGYTDEHVLQLSDLEGTGPTVLHDQLSSFTNFEPQPSWSTQRDGTTLSPFEYGTIFGLQTDVCNDLAMTKNSEGVADSSTAANCLTSMISKTVFDPSHADSADDYPQQSTYPAELNSSTSQSALDTRRSDRDSLVGYSKSTISVLEDPQPTRNLALDDRSLGNNEKDRNQTYLKWISYDRSSFTDNTIAPRPIHTCDLPDNRKRGRREPLSESKRKKIAEMRLLKSCLLCRMKKKDCDPGTPCKRCLYRARSQPSLLPCIRAPLADLTAAFVPLIPFPDFALNSLFSINMNSLQTTHHSLTCLPMVLSHLDSDDETKLSSAQEALNIWADNAVDESITKVNRVYCLVSAQGMRVLEAIMQIFVDRARPPVVKDALKILLLFNLFKNPNITGNKSVDRYRSVSARKGFIHKSCVMSLIEQILSKLLPRLQTLLLQRYRTDWAVVVSAMTVLSMTAEKWVLCKSERCRKGRSSKMENGWSVLLGLYTAAYGGYYLPQANSPNRSIPAQSDEAAWKLRNELKILVKHDGDCDECWVNYYWCYNKIHVVRTFGYVARLISDKERPRVRRRRLIREFMHM